MNCSNAGFAEAPWLRSYRRRRTQRTAGTATGLGTPMHMRYAPHVVVAYCPLYRFRPRIARLRTLKPVPTATIALPTPHDPHQFHRALRPIWFSSAASRRQKPYRLTGWGRIPKCFPDLSSFPGEGTKTKHSWHESPHIPKSSERTRERARPIRRSLQRSRKTPSICRALLLDQHFRSRTSPSSPGAPPAVGFF